MGIVSSCLIEILNLIACASKIFKDQGLVAKVKMSRFLPKGAGLGLGCFAKCKCHQCVQMLQRRPGGMDVQIFAATGQHMEKTNSSCLSRALSAFN